MDGQEKKKKKKEPFPKSESDNSPLARLPKNAKKCQKKNGSVAAKQSKAKQRHVMYNKI